jgi:hypothetical protein
MISKMKPVSVSFLFIFFLMKNDIMNLCEIPSML